MNLSQTCHVIPEEKEEEEEEISHISMVGLKWISLLLECEDRIRHHDRKKKRKEVEHEFAGARGSSALDQALDTYTARTEGCR